MIATTIFEAPEQKKNLIYITKFLVKVNCYLLIRMSALQNTVCRKVGNPFLHKNEQPQEEYKAF